MWGTYLRFPYHASTGTYSSPRALVTTGRRCAQSRAGKPRVPAPRLGSLVFPSSDPSKKMEVAVDSSIALTETRQGANRIDHLQQFQIGTCSPRMNCVSISDAPRREDPNRSTKYNTSHTPHNAGAQLEPPSLSGREMRRANGSGQPSPGVVNNPPPSTITPSITHPPTPGLKPQMRPSLGLMT